MDNFKGCLEMNTLHVTVNLHFRFDKNGNLMHPEMCPNHLCNKLGCV